jgi:ubiquinone/menaquinone biosynthesis C-methylase UbiE
VRAPAYDRLGVAYSEVRRADPRFEAAIRDALGDAGSVLNVGAGAGSYEPRDREVIAVEPSEVMIAQRPAGAAPAIAGFAESLPLADKSVDATMGVFTMQHWDDVDRGLAEVLRVTRERVVLLTLDLDPGHAGRRPAPCHGGARLNTSMPSEDFYASLFGATYSAYMERPRLGRLVGRLVWGGDIAAYYYPEAARSNR